MQFDINRDLLLKSLNFVQGVVEKKNTLPILSNVLIIAKESKLNLVATDLDLVFYARLSFAFCCVCMIFSIFLFLQEIRLSNEALKFHLSDMDSMKKDL